MTSALAAERSSDLEPPRVSRGWRGVGSAALSVLACALVWIALTIPNELARLTPASLLRIPLEGLLIVGLLLLLKPEPRQAVGALVGFVLGLLVIVKILDMGFYVAFNRPFNPAVDFVYLPSAVDLLRLSIGRSHAIIALAVTGVLIAVILLLLPLAMLRVVRLVDHHRTGVFRTTLVLAIAWLSLGAWALIHGGTSSLASASTATSTAYHLGQVRAGLADTSNFERAAADDPLGSLPKDKLLAGLRGKDVIVAFVESYGRVAVEDPSLAPGVTAALATGDARLAESGFSARSGYLTSSTFGGLSWLAHSTLQSGLLIDNQQRYDLLLATDRLTLTSLFEKAGWRTAALVPANERAWPEGQAFYGFDTIYDDRNMGYLGRHFGFATMPDQFIWSVLQRRELSTQDHPPLMAEVDLVSSHTPWAKLPEMVDWKDVGTGAVFSNMAAAGPSPEQLWRDPANVKVNYGKSIEYSLNALTSFVQNYGSDNLVMVVLGDHQPSTMVAGQGASHDVPISIVAKDPAVMDRLADWGWTAGLQPGPSAPVMPMESFRDLFVQAFS